MLWGLNTTLWSLPFGGSMGVLRVPFVGLYQGFFCCSNCTCESVFPLGFCLGSRLTFHAPPVILLVFRCDLSLSYFVCCPTWSFLMVFPFFFWHTLCSLFSSEPRCQASYLVIVSALPLAIVWFLPSWAPSSYWSTTTISLRLLILVVTCTFITPPFMVSASYMLWFHCLVRF